MKAWTLALMMVVGLLGGSLVAASAAPIDDAVANHEARIRALEVRAGIATPTPVATTSPTGTPVPSASPTPRPTASPSPVPTASPTPPGNVYFARLAPKAALPDGATCAQQVKARPEYRPQNSVANHTIPTPEPSTVLDGADDANDWSRQRNYNERIDGNYAGTTDEIIQWVACKWGLDEDDLRAKAAVESSWRQSLINADGEYSVGLMQVNQNYHHCLPACIESTAYNADWAAAWQRACVDGDFDWLGSDYLSTVANYNSGSNATRLHEGCLAVWYAGDWYTGSGGTGNTYAEYLAEWRDARSSRVWLGYR